LSIALITNFLRTAYCFQAGWDSDINIIYLAMGDESEIGIINFKIPEVKIFEYTPPE
jgi:hypothetical protein